MDNYPKKKKLTLNQMFSKEIIGSLNFSQRKLLREYVNTYYMLYETNEDKIQKLYDNLDLIKATIDLLTHLDADKVTEHIERSIQCQKVGLIWKKMK